MIASEGRAIEGDLKLAFAIGNKRRDQPLRLMLYAVEPIADQSGVFGKARIENGAIARLNDVFGLSAFTQRLFALMPNEGLVREDCAIAAARGAHHKIILFVVAPAIGLIEKTKFRKHLGLNQHGKANGG